MYYTDKECENYNNFIEKIPKVDHSFLDEMDKAMKNIDLSKVIIIDDEYLLEEGK